MEFLRPTLYRGPDDAPEVPSAPRPSHRAPNPGTSHRPIGAPQGLLSHSKRNRFTYLVCNSRFPTCLSTSHFSFNPKCCRLLHAPTAHTGWASRWVKLNTTVSNIRNQSTYFQTLYKHYKCNEFLSFFFFCGGVVLEGRASLFFKQHLALFPELTSFIKVLKYLN